MNQSICYIFILKISHTELNTSLILILSGIAVADVLVMIEYIPFTVHMYILDEVGVGLKRKCIFQFSRKCENHAKMGRFPRNFAKLSRNFAKILAKTKNQLNFTVIR
jgi:hypothetical protein